MSTKFKQTEIGEIPEEWVVFDLDKIIEKIIDYRGKTPSKAMSGIPLITAKIVKDGRVDLSSLEYLAESDYDSWMRRGLPRKGDVVLTTEAPLGEVAQVPDFKIALAQRIIALRGKKDVLDNTYLKYYFLSVIGRNQLASKASGSVVTGIKQSELRKIKVVVPHLKEQEIIVNILSSLDDKIELNRKMNKTLEDMAKALFKHWFVDFEFPDENGKPYKSSGGEMMESELGSIPKGWRTKKLMDIADISIGRTPPRMQTQWFSENSEDIGWLSIRDMGSCGVYVGKTSEYLTKEAVDKFSIPIIPKNTVVLSFKLTVGRVAISTADMLSNEAIAHIKLTNKVYSTEYTYLILKSIDFSSLGTTSSIATAVNSQSIKGIPITEPDSRVLSIFSERIQPIFSEILVMQKQIDTLSQLRDSLLPKLMSGKIRVK